MKVYQLYLEKIVNALSRAGISFPAPNFTDYEGMCSYVAGLSSFLELNSQLQKAGAGVVLMGLEETTTFKSYWNSEFYLEFQERKLLESKLSSDDEDFSFANQDAEYSSVQETEFLNQSADEELQEIINTEKEDSELVVTSPTQNNTGFDMSNVVFIDDDEDEEFDSDDEYLEEEVEDVEEEAPVNDTGYDMSNVVFVDDDEDEDEEGVEELEYLDVDEEILESGYLESTEELSSSTDSEDTGTPKGVDFSQLVGCDTSNIIFSDEEDEIEDVEEYEYDEDGFIIDRDEPIEDDSEDEEEGEEYLDEYEYDEDGFIIDRSEPEEDDDEEDDGEEYLDEYEYDEDGFIIDRSEPEEDDDEDEDDFEFIEDVDDDFEFVEDDSPLEESMSENLGEYTTARSTNNSDRGTESDVSTTPQVTKPQSRKPKELQETDKILSIFNGIEGKLRKKVQSVKKEPKN
jgi:hypothetical protein